MKKIILGIIAVSIIALNSSFSQGSEFLMPAKKHGSWGFINKQGDWMIPNKYEEA